MNRKQIEDKLAVYLKNGTGFEKSSYAKSPEWLRVEFAMAMKHLSDSKVDPENVFIRWMMFRRGVAAAFTGMQSMVLGGVPL